MSRFLFATAGSLGDLHPHVAVARALLQRGHQAVVAAAEDHRAPVEAAGVEFAPVRPRASDIGDYQALVTRLTARRLASELAALLDRPSYAREARAVAEALTRVDGARCAAEELIACAQPSDSLIPPIAPPRRGR